MFLHLPLLLNSMRPCQLVRAPRVHCAIIVRLRAHGLGLRQGLRPYNPGRNLRFLHLPPFTQKYAAYMPYFAIYPSYAI